MKSLNELHREKIDNYYRRLGLYTDEQKSYIKLLWAIFGQSKEDKEIFAPRKKLTKRERAIRNKERYMYYYLNNVDRRMGILLRNRINRALERNQKAGHLTELLGCSVKHLKRHLENRFSEGMSWENHGKWHIDHIKSCCSFDLSKKSEQKKCFHYTNLRPLWAKENLSRPKFRKIKS